MTTAPRPRDPLGGESGGESWPWPDSVLPFPQRQAAQTRLLLVDDDPAEAKLLGQMFRDSAARRFDVVVAGSVAAGLLALAEHPPVHCLLLDLSLPDGSGLHALAALSQRAPELPVVALAAEDELETALSAVACGAEDYLLKGHFDAGSLVRTVHHAMERRAAQRTLREQERLLGAVLNAVPTPTVVLDGSGRIAHTNQAWRLSPDLLGWRSADDPGYLRRLDALAATGSGSARELAAALRQVLSGVATSANLEYEGRGPGQDRSRWHAVTIVGLPDVDCGALVTYEDVTSERRRDADAAHLALRDGLTGLPNRPLLADRVEQALRRAERSGWRCAILFCDLDGFKNLNDLHGYATGDEVLRQAAGRLYASVRASDTVARFAADEFVVVCEGLVDLAEAEAIARRLQEALAPPYVLGPATAQAGVTIGVALSEDPAHETPAGLLAGADAALHEARGRGRGSVAVYAGEHRAALLGRGRLEQELRDGLRDGQLLYHYQPLYAAWPRRVVGVEALVRWQHPTKGTRTPDQFLDIAAETGLLATMLAATLPQAMTDLARWRAGLGSDLTLWVNLSARQLADPDTVNRLVTVRDAQDLPPGSVGVEVTEDVLLREDAVPALAALRSYGVPIALDDFGTGYASLGYLRRFTVDAVKVDGSFIAGMGEDRTSRTIVASIIDLAKTLGIRCVAEGIETAEQARWLTELGCHELQGYHLGRPVPAEAVGALLS